MIKINFPFLLFISFILILSACQKDVEDPLNYKLNSFSYVDQNEQRYGLNELKGKVWIADFIFTSCETICPPMTANMSKLQQEIKKKGIKNVEFVSFSVDPENDKPDVLKTYINKFNADSSQWHLLTGYTQKEIESFAMNNFKIIVQKPKSSDQVIHGTKFFLVDDKGTVKQEYEGVKQVPFEQIINDIKIVQDNAK
ncbi:SCO family protein [Priestia megaterium]|uniref:SCO family protein n=1 Tax=Priestia megaterium TaxID=1404 RepID=UPI00237B2CBC|nr:SCO family protein [Priestia megaterium]MDD9791672.1 SCO family protein [Priestia megaterium]